MEIREGFEVDNGVIFPWRISPSKAKSIIGNSRFDEVTHEYLVTRCKALEGLAISLGLHFKSRKLVEFELFRQDAIDLGDSYCEFQKHLEAVFGLPTRTFPGNDELSCGFFHHEWRMGPVRIRHYVLNRFGPEEHVRIS